MLDPFFEVIADGEGNACIGKQGDALNYVEGYVEAAQLLVAAVLDRRLYGSATRWRCRFSTTRVTVSSYR